MQNIKVSRYSNPNAHGWAGYLEPEDASWIAFIGLNGAPRLFLSRDPQTGAILPDDPIERDAHLEALRSGTQPGLRIGMADDGSSGATSLAPGERVFPLGFDGRGAT